MNASLSSGSQRDGRITALYERLSRDGDLTGDSNSIINQKKLHEHCAEIDAATRSRLDLIMPGLAKSAGATEALKAADPMKWVGLMKLIKSYLKECAIIYFKKFCV